MGGMCQNRNVLARLFACHMQSMFVCFEASVTCVNAVSAGWLDEREGLEERQNETGSWFPTRLTVTRSLLHFD